MTINRAVLPLLTASAALTLTGCAAGTPTAEEPALEAEEAALEGCDAFAYHLQQADGDPRAMDRRTVVQEIAVELDKANGSVGERMTSNLDHLESAAVGPETDWVIAADDFAGTCMDLGWSVDQ